MPDAKVIQVLVVFDLTQVPVAYLDWVGMALHSWPALNESLWKLQKWSTLDQPPPPLICLLLEAFVTVDSSGKLLPGFLPQINYQKVWGRKRANISNEMLLTGENNKCSFIVSLWIVGFMVWLCSIAEDRLNLERGC